MVAKATSAPSLRQRLLARAAKMISLGTEGYPPKTARRLKSVNVGAYTIAVSCLLVRDHLRGRGRVALQRCGDPEPGR